MRIILDFLLKLVVFFLGWIFFPSIFQFNNLTSIIVTVILLYIASILLSFVLFAVISKLADIDAEWLFFIICFVLALTFNMIAISLVSIFYSGFHFGGDIKALFITSILISVFSVNVKHEQEFI